MDGHQTHFLHFEKYTIKVKFVLQSTNGGGRLCSAPFFL